MRHPHLKPGWIRWGLLAGLITTLAGHAQSELRNAQVGDPMPAFTLPQLDGAPYQYTGRPGRLLCVLFVSPQHRESERAVTELAQVLHPLEDKPWEALLVSIRQVDKAYFDALLPERPKQMHVAFDTAYQLWGKLGVIAIPTLILVDGQGRIAWVKPGHGYDFLSSVRAHIHELLGVSPTETGPAQPSASPNRAEPAAQPVIRALDNGTPDKRMAAHLNMARLLIERGHLEEALAEMKQAQALAPESIEVQLEMAQLLCRTQRPQEALNLTAAIRPRHRADEAMLHMITGWAYRLTGRLDQATAALQKALALNPRLARAAYELGQVYEAQGRYQEAAAAYRRALAEMFHEATAGPQPVKNQTP